MVNQWTLSYVVDLLYQFSVYQGKPFSKELFTKVARGLAI